MLSTILNARGEPHLVDNRKANAVMYAAGSANTVFFQYFYDRKHTLEFDWNQQNIDQRNCLNLVSSSGAAQGIRRWCYDLVHRGLMDVNDPPRVVGHRVPLGWCQ